MGGLIVIVSLSVSLTFRKALFQSPCLMWSLCSIAILVIWRRDEYEITGEIFVIFPVSVFVVSKDDYSTLGSI